MKLRELRQIIREEISKARLNEETNLNKSQDSNPYEGKKYQTLRNPLGVKAGLIGTLKPSVVTNKSTGLSRKVFEFHPDNSQNVYSDFPRKYLKPIY